jgi:dCTP deaminase
MENNQCLPVAKPDPDTQNLFADAGAGTAVLVAEDIAAMAQNGRLISREFDDKSLQATSYDCRIGERAIVGGHSNETDLKRDRLVIEPGSYAGVISLEKVKLPSNVFAQIGSKRKFSYDGLILLTGSVIDPGYEGYLLFGLYNASTKKVVLPIRTKICNVVFHRLSKEVKAVPPDPYLLNGEFPPDFLKQMANVEVLPWVKITEEVRRIQDLTRDIFDLKKQYSDVLKPISDLTTNVDKVNTDVRLLAEQVRAVSGQVGKLDEFSQSNAKLVNEIAVNVKALSTKVGDQDKELREVATKIGRYGVFWTVLWAIILIALTVSATLLVRKAFPDAPPQKGSPAPATSPHPKGP